MMNGEAHLNLTHRLTVQMLCDKVGKTLTPTSAFRKWAIHAK